MNELPQQFAKAQIKDRLWRKMRICLSALRAFENMTFHIQEAVTLYAFFALELAQWLRLPGVGSQQKVNLYRAKFFFVLSFYVSLVYIKACFIIIQSMGMSIIDLTSNPQSPGESTF